jgi:hypothetical protein
VLLADESRTHYFRLPDQSLQERTVSQAARDRNWTEGGRYGKATSSLAALVGEAGLRASGVACELTVFD